MKSKLDSPPGPDYRNPELSVKRRVKDLLSRMKLKEKVAQMLCIWQQKPNTMVDEKGRFDLEKAKAQFKDRLGLGQVGRPAQRCRRRPQRPGNGRTDERHSEVLRREHAAGHPGRLP